MRFILPPPRTETPSGGTQENYADVSESDGAARYGTGDCLRQDSGSPSSKQQNRIPDAPMMTGARLRSITIGPQRRESRYHGVAMARRANSRRHSTLL